MTAKILIAKTVERVSTVLGSIHAIAQMAIQADIVKEVSMHL